MESNSIRMTIPLDRLTGTAKQKIPTKKSKVSVQSSIYDEMNEKRAHFNPTLDLRGHRAEEALNELHQFLDTAMLLSEKEVRILHGKGYGILMQVSPHLPPRKGGTRWRRCHHRGAPVGGHGFILNLRVPFILNQRGESKPSAINQASSRQTTCKGLCFEPLPVLHTAVTIIWY